MAKKKPLIELRGLLMDPVTAGKSAVICLRHGLRITSTVLRTAWVSRDVLRFETRNTDYLLHLEKGNEQT